MLLDRRPCARRLNSGRTLGRGTSSPGGMKTSPKSTWDANEIWLNIHKHTNLPHLLLKHHVYTNHSRDFAHSTSQRDIVSSRFNFRPFNILFSPCCGSLRKLFLSRQLFNICSLRYYKRYIDYAENRGSEWKRLSNNENWHVAEWVASYSRWNFCQLMELCHRKAEIRVLPFHRNSRDQLSLINWKIFSGWWR